ncbi:endonuclease [Aureococcus anophagefferens]|nr:endonuclease [Aureococcus anophagefferens]
MKRPYDAVAPPAARYPIAPGAPPPVYDAYAPASGANPCFEFLRSGSCRNGDRCKYAESVRETLEAGKRDRARPPPPPPADGDAVHDDEVYLRNVNYLYGSQQLARVMERAFKGRVLAVRLAPCADPARGRRPLPGGSCWVGSPGAARRASRGRDRSRRRREDLPVAHEGAGPARGRPAGPRRGLRASGTLAALRRRRRRRGARPLWACSTAVFAALGRVRADGRVLPLLDEARRAADVICYNAAISAAGSAGDRALALGVLRALVGDPAAEPDAISYNAAIAACERAGDCDGALRLFASLKRRGLRPTAVSYNAVAARAGRPLGGGLECLGRMPGDGVPPDSVVYHAVGPDVAVAAARLALRDVVDEPETRPFFSLAGTVAALDPETGETDDAAGDDLVIRADCDASLAAVADLLRDAFPQLDAAPAKGAVAIGHRDPNRADAGSGSGFASRRTRAASCSAAMRARTSSACDRGAGP